MSETERDCIKTKMKGEREIENKKYKMRKRDRESASVCMYVCIVVCENYSSNTHTLQTDLLGMPMY